MSPSGLVPVHTPFPTNRADVDFVAQFRTAAHRLTTLTGKQLYEAIRDIPRVEKLLHALLGEDAEYQREFRRAVIVALSHMPTQSAPPRLGLNVLRACIAKHGVEPALAALLEPEVPTWTQLIRMYRPDYAQGSNAAKGTRYVNDLIRQIETGEEVDISGLSRDQQRAITTAAPAGRPIVHRAQRGTKSAGATKRRAPKVYVKSVRTTADLLRYVNELQAERRRLAERVAIAWDISRRARREGLTEIPAEWLTPLTD